MSEKNFDNCDGNCYDCNQDHAPEMIKMLESMGITPEIAAGLEWGMAIADARKRMEQSDEIKPEESDTTNFIGPNPGEAEEILNSIMNDMGNSFGEVDEEDPFSMDGMDFEPFDVTKVTINLDISEIFINCDKKSIEKAIKEVISELIKTFYRVTIKDISIQTM